MKSIRELGGEINFFWKIWWQAWKNWKIGGEIGKFEKINGNVGGKIEKYNRLIGCKIGKFKKVK